MSQGYHEVLGRISHLRAASDNMLAIDNMINGMNDANDRRMLAQVTPADLVQAQVSLVEQLGDMIAARRNYRANNQLLEITDALLDAADSME